MEYFLHKCPLSTSSWTDIGVVSWQNVKPSFMTSYQPLMIVGMLTWMDIGSWSNLIYYSSKDVNGFVTSLDVSYL